MARNDQDILDEHGDEIIHCYQEGWPLKLLHQYFGLPTETVRQFLVDKDVKIKATLRKDAAIVYVPRPVINTEPAPVTDPGTLQALRIERETGHLSSAERRKLSELTRPPTMPSEDGNLPVKKTVSLKDFARQETKRLKKKLGDA